MPLPILSILSDSLRGMRAHAGFLTLLALPWLVLALVDLGLGIAEAPVPEGAEMDFGPGRPLSPQRLILILVMSWLSLTLSVNVARLVLLGRTSMGSPLREALRLGQLEFRVLLAGLLMGLVMTVPAAILIGVSAGAGHTAVLVIGSLALTVLAVWVSVRLILIVPAVAMGQTSVGSIRESWRLTRGQSWRLLGLFFLCILIVLGATLLLALLGSLAAAAIGIVLSLATGGSMATAGVITKAGSGAVQVALQVAGTVFTMAVAAMAFRHLAPPVQADPPPDVSPGDLRMPHVALTKPSPDTEAPPESQE